MDCNANDALNSRKQLRFSDDTSRSSTDSTSTVIYCPSDSDITFNSHLKERQANGFNERSPVPPHSSRKQSSKKVVCEECDTRVPIEDLKKHLKSHDYTVEQIKDFMKIRCKLSVERKTNRCKIGRPRQVTSNKPINGTAKKLMCKMCNKTFSSEEPLKKHLSAKHLYTFKMADTYLITGECQHVQTQHMVRNNREIHHNVQPTNTASCKTNSQMLAVAIMGANNYQLTEEQAMQVKQYLQKKINEAISTKTIQPSFTADSIFADGALKLWCEDESTWNWLLKTVEHLNINRCPRLILKPQCEVNAKLVKATVILRNINESVNKAILSLTHQNEWAQVNTWIIISRNIISKRNLLLVCEIPEKLFPFIKRNNMCLTYNQDSVILRPY